MTKACVDGNEAVARVAYPLSELVAIYPITPATPMGEHADAWSAAGRPNLWGRVPEVVEMQSEGGAAGALHGAAMEGALATTFTSSQGLLLMLPNMFKLAGELTPAVIHVAARTVATHALSIFGDHSDVMAVRSSGFIMLASCSVQEAQDLAAVAHATTLEARLPVLHFFDGFRTSHEVHKIELLGADDLRALVSEEALLAHRERALRPEQPDLRGSAQNPDVFFQAREAASPFFAAAPRVVEQVLDRLAEQTGRRYHLVEYQGAPDADRVIVVMGSAAGAAAESVQELCARGERVGLVTVRLFRPFPSEALVAALPSTVRAVAVLDRTKDPGAPGEPLYQDVITALARGAASRDPKPLVIGGRYGLASKQFTPAMAKAVFDELSTPCPRDGFTVGINDDVSGTSLAVDTSFSTDGASVRALFFGLGSDGTVSAAKSIAKIVGASTDLDAQDFPVYDSKKSGSMTVSHLRVDPRPIRSTYLIRDATFIGCSQFGLLATVDALAAAVPGATVLLNSPFPAEGTWDHLPREAQEAILAKNLSVWVVPASRLAAEAGAGAQVNTVMEACFFALTALVPVDDALAEVKREIERSYGGRGGDVVAANVAAVDRARAHLSALPVPTAVTSHTGRRPVVPPEAPDFVQRVTALMLAGEGDRLPVSAFAPDGRWPTATSRWEKRRLAAEIPVWDPDLCIDCGKCTIVCPHAAIRMKVFEPDVLDEAPEGFLSKSFRSRELPGMMLTVQVAPDDCTGCAVCVDVCPAVSKVDRTHKSINMRSFEEHAEDERVRWDFFLDIPPLPPGALDPASVKGSQVRDPLFEFSGACAGCGETPYLKLLSQLFGDRLIVANATGCSSIYGGNLPTTPWCRNEEGIGPAWANSLFEDNAEFGFGIGLAAEHHAAEARALLERLASRVGDDLASSLLENEQRDDAAIARQHKQVEQLRERLANLEDADARRLLSIADYLVPKSVWLVGGDGWAYDIGFGGLDHVLASGRNVNVLVLDTEVYSNTGGQASKATPRGATAKFAVAGKPTAKKDLGMLAAAYGNVYVAQVAIGANDVQTVKALLEAEAWPGPSLVIGYGVCIEHGFDMSKGMSHQKDVVKAGLWPLYRVDPGTNPRVKLDSHAPTVAVRDVVLAEERYARLLRADPENAANLLDVAQADANERWQRLARLAAAEAEGGDG